MKLTKQQATSELEKIAYKMQFDTIEIEGDTAIFRESDDFTLYIQKIDCLHVKIHSQPFDDNQQGSPAIWHIAQLKDNIYHDDVLAWLKG